MGLNLWDGWLVVSSSYGVRHWRFIRNEWDFFYGHMCFRVVMGKRVMFCKDVFWEHGEIIHILRHWLSLNYIGKKGIEFPQLPMFSLLPLECARVFFAAGAKLVLCGRNREALEELTRELAASRVTEVSPGACFL